MLVSNGTFSKIKEYFGKSKYTYWGFILQCSFSVNVISYTIHIFVSLLYHLVSITLIKYSSCISDFQRDFLFSMYLGSFITSSKNFSNANITFCGQYIFSHFITRAKSNFHSLGLLRRYIITRKMIAILKFCIRKLTEMF